MMQYSHLYSAAFSEQSCRVFHISSPAVYFFLIKKKRKQCAQHHVPRTGLCPCAGLLIGVVCLATAQHFLDIHLPI